MHVDVIKTLFGILSDRGSSAKGASRRTLTDEERTMHELFGILLVVMGSSVIGLAAVFFGVHYLKQKYQAH